MTMFETLASNLGVKIELDDEGRYIGMAAALKRIADDVIFSETGKLTLEQMENVMIKRFYDKFPYTRK